ncbi:MAG: T9SS type A sorting domain-containing protein [Bacteroidota bacterium]|nr:T9SS type A sorting domain-containing protein [Bacteroidota bacterium]
MFATSGTVTMDLYDVQGRLLINVASYEADGGEERLTTTNVDQLSNGVYLLRILHGEEISSRQVIISK